MNLLKYFDGGLIQYIVKSAYPLGGVDSSNPCRRRGWQSTTMGVVFVVCSYNVRWGWSHDVTSSLYVCKKIPNHKPKVRLRMFFLCHPGLTTPSLVHLDVCCCFPCQFLPNRYIWQIWTSPTSSTSPTPSTLAIFPWKIAINPIKYNTIILQW